MKTHGLLFMLGTFLIRAQRVRSRTWTMIDLVHTYFGDYDDSGTIYLAAEESRLFEESIGESRPPMILPTYERFPTTNRPSPSPSNAPSSPPSFRPTSLPSSMPSISPTQDPFPESEEPDDPIGSYFSYDPKSPRGPNRWDQYEFPDDYYWDEFDRPGFGTWRATLAGNVDLERNFCNDGLQQSPIDLDVHNGGICTEFHEVRSIGGDCNVPGDNVNSLIESNKLRLEYRRRNCQDSSLPECRLVDPPRADFPGGWLNFADVLHVDFKIPSEHTMKGKRFDAEMQIVHLHPINKRLVVQSVLIEADEKGFNYYLQQALRAFHETFNSNLVRCRKRRRLSAGHDDAPATTSDLWRDLSRNLTITSSPDDDTNRSLQQLDGPWDPHHPMLVPTIHYYRYDGSTTEPPCTEFVTWYVADEPMKISSDQLLMMKTMLFTNVDGRDCRPTSTHWEESVARPLQNVNGRTTHHCTPADFGPDP